MVGAGQRGHFVYGRYATDFPKDLTYVGVADPNPAHRDRFAKAQRIPVDARVEDWADLLGLEADLWIIASPDRHHRDPAVAAVEAGSHVLLEKPIAATAADVVDVVEAARRSDRQLHVAHVLRYSPFFTTLNEVVRSGRLGDIITVEHRENVVSWHMAHSFVRGNWAKAGDSSPMIVQKCCHDFDVLEWNLPAPVTRLHSFGRLAHFRPEHAPDGAPDRCTDGCPAESSCPYEAKRLYMNERWTGWPVHVITDDMSPAGRMNALRHGPYGRCVYTAGSDVVDHQVVSMEREDGSTTVLVMHGHSAEESRTMRYDGTRGTLRARFGHTQVIELTEHRSGETTSFPIGTAAGGHGGGDRGLIGGVIDAIRSGTGGLTRAEQALESHLLAFASEAARSDGGVIDLPQFRRQAGRDSSKNSRNTSR
jgi:predicted dehydrogenase